MDPIYGLPPDLVVGPSADVLPLAGEVNWGMDVFAVERLRTLTNGEGVVVCGIDTGIDREHPLLTNCFAAKDFTGSPIGAGDRNQHGTHISGTIAATDPRIGVAPGCKFCHGKALSDGGSGAGSWIAAAIRWGMAQGAEIISMSLGSSSPDPTIIAAMKEAADAGVWVAAAAGNSGGNTSDVDWPGRSEHCISVAALNPDLTPASFSSAGAKIDTSGPGVNIWSTKPGGGYQQMSGTSMATPFIAGLLALYRSALKARNLPIPSVYELRKLLFEDSTDTHTPGDDRRTGPGWANPLLLTLNLVPDPPPVSRRASLLAIAGLGMASMASAAFPDPPPVTPDPPPVRRVTETRTETRIVTTTRSPHGHTHTCRNGHTWDHLANPTHVCQQCGASQTVQDARPRMVTTYTRQSVGFSSVSEVPAVQQIIRSQSSGCANGYCPLPQRR